MTYNITAKTIAKYSLFGAAVLVFFALINVLFIDMKPENFDTAEVVGYTSMVLSMLLIFLALNEYRLSQPQQTITFKKGLAVGLAISAIGGILFGVYNWIYVTFINPEFMDQYFNYYIETIKNSGESEQQIQQTISQLEMEKEMFQSPLVQFFVMFITEFAIGVVITLLAAGFEVKRSAKAA